MHCPYCEPCGWTAYDECLNAIRDGKSVLRRELVERVIRRRLHARAHKRARWLHASRTPERTAELLVSRALQRLRRSGDIQRAPIGRGWVAL